MAWNWPDVIGGANVVAFILLTGGAVYYAKKSGDVQKEQAEMQKQQTDIETQQASIQKEQTDIMARQATMLRAQLYFNQRQVVEGRLAKVRAKQTQIRTMWLAITQELGLIDEFRKGHLYSRDELSREILPWVSRLIGFDLPALFETIGRDRAVEGYQFLNGIQDAVMKPDLGSEWAAAVLDEQVIRPLSAFANLCTEAISLLVEEEEKVQEELSTIDEQIQALNSEA